MQTATNPQTGERFVLVNGEWQPLQTATNQETGQQFALINNEWQPMPSTSATPPGPSAPPPRPFQETLDTIGSSLVGGLAGTARGLYGAFTGEDYETARANQDRVAESLIAPPKSAAGKEMVGGVYEALDLPILNYISETGEAWGQNTNDYLLDTPFEFAAPAAGFVAGMGPDIAATAATGGAGAALTRGARIANNARKERSRRNTMAPALKESVEAANVPAGLSVGAAETDLARRNVAAAAELPYPITLTQGQATRNAAQMTDEFNLVRQGRPEDVAPLANLQQQQQRALQQNLQYVADTLDRAEPAKLGSDELLGRSVKETLEQRRLERKEKTGALYNAAEEQGDLDTPISITKLDDAFAELESLRFNRTEPAKMKLLRDLADDIGVSAGQPARIRDVEEFRQQINNVLKDVTNSNDTKMAKILKNAVDEALDGVPEAAEAYKRARASYSRDKSAFDGNALVTNITGKKGRTESPSVPDADVYKRIVNGPMEDARGLLRETAKTPGGVNMIHNIGARLMEDLIESSRKSGVDGDGGFNSAALAKALRKLDKSGRLEAIYGPQRADQLRRVAEVGEMINSLPYGNAANFSQSGNTMVKELTNIVGMLPVPLLSRGVRMAGDAYNDGVLRQRQQKRIKKALDVEGLLSYE